MRFLLDEKFVTRRGSHFSAMGSLNIELDPGGKIHEKDDSSDTESNNSTKFEDVCFLSLKLLSKFVTIFRPMNGC